MKKTMATALSVLAALLLCVPVRAAHTRGGAAARADFTTYSEAYVVMDAKTGQVLLEKNMDKRQYPASITKILTVAVALERVKSDDRLTMSAASVSSVSRSSTHIALTEGEELSVEDAMMATMLTSANDAANGLAEYAGGSLEMFCALMNKTALKAGAENSNFVNANGLEDDNHYTTAYDMAAITRYALSVEGFREVFGATEYTMQPTNKQPDKRNFGTQHHMIVYSAYQYKGAWGGKLGWTPQARHTAVTVAERDGKELICVVMNSTNKWEKYKDTKKLLDYAYNNMNTVTVTAGVDRVKNIPVVENNSVVGVAKLAAQSKSYELYVPDGVEPGDIDVSYTTKVRYEKGEVVEPMAVFSLMKQGGAEEELLCAPLSCEVVLDSEPAQQVLSIIEPGPAQPEKKSEKTAGALIVTGSVLGGLVLLFMITRFAVQRYYRKKRARRNAMRFYR